MKKNIVFLGILLLLLGGITGCKKKIDEIKTDALVDLMVARKWEIKVYMDGTTDVTSEFNGYEFQFYKDYTVLGTNGTISKTGTWNGDVNAGKITSTFTNAATPISRLNGTWTVYYYDSRGPKFNQFINGVEMKLELREK